MIDRALSPRAHIEGYPEELVPESRALSLARSMAFAGPCVQESPMEHDILAITLNLLILLREPDSGVRHWTKETTDSGGDLNLLGSSRFRWYEVG